MATLDSQRIQYIIRSELEMALVLPIFVFLRNTLLLLHIALV